MIRIRLSDGSSHDFDEELTTVAGKVQHARERRWMVRLGEDGGRLAVIHPDHIVSIVEVGPPRPSKPDPGVRS